MTDEVKITLSGRVLDRLLREAREDEREACAELIEGRECTHYADIVERRALADAIRARSNHD